MLSISRSYVSLRVILTIALVDHNIALEQYESCMDRSIVQSHVIRKVGSILKHTIDGAPNQALNGR